MMPRVMLAAPASGSGKTLVTCGILQALVNRGMRVASFKSGPDYIDPMFHGRIIGTTSRNIDTFFTGPGTTRYLFGRIAKDSDISVIEGVMGFFDGLGGTSVRASSYDVSCTLDAPVVLIVNCKGASISCVPVIKGFLEFRKGNIRGVILNNMSERIFRDVRTVIEDELDVKVIGYVPNVKDLILESRHLGLVLPSEIEGLKERLNSLAGVLERTLDIDALIRIAEDAAPVEYDVPEFGTVPGVKVGVARDDAFCFIYPDNIDILERMGAEVVYFSPLCDAHVPDVDGVILPGGYPELYADRLSSNASFMEDLRMKLSDGMPCMAECGGFMYLHREMEDRDGRFHRMVGVIDGRAFNNKGLSRFGYISVEGKEGSIMDGSVKGHEFHYWESTDPGNDCVATRPSAGTGYGCMHTDGNTALGFPHLYYYSDPSIPLNFLRRCSDHRGKRKG